METLLVHCALLVIVIIAIRAYFKTKYGYWERRGVACLKTNIPFGTMRNILTEKVSLQEILEQQYVTCKKNGHKFVGLYMITAPHLMIIDPELIKCVLSKSFNHFMERGIYNQEDDPLSMHLFSLGTSRWKQLRPKLTPTFSSGKMKMMFPMVLSCARQLKVSMAETCTKGPVDIKQILECYTMDVIGSCAFGIDCNSFTDPSSDFCRYSKRILQPTRLENLIGITVNLFPKFGKALGLKGIPKDITEFFFDIVRRSVARRREIGTTRNDFLQILMELLDSQNGDSISFNEMVAQAFVFFIGGFETSSATISFCLLELCLNPDVHNRLRSEVNSVLNRHNGDITYENIKEMKYMDAVIDETLRKYPPLSVLNRQCIQDYQLPNTSITIEKGIKIAIPLVGLHNDPDYFPEPKKFIPERFQNRDLIRSYTFMPFGKGPRSCIGIRFGLMQTKVGLSVLLKHYKFELSSRMEVPVKFKTRSFLTAVEGGIWLNVLKI